MTEALREDLRNDRNKGWVGSMIIEYDPESFEQFDTIAQIRIELQKLDPKNPDHTFMYLLHLNREASRIVSELGHPRERSVSDALFHTANKDIWSAIFFSDKVDKTDLFKNAIDFILMDISAI